MDTYVCYNLRGGIVSGQEFIVVGESLRSSTFPNAENPFLLRAFVLPVCFFQQAKHSRTGGGPYHPCYLVRRWSTQLRTHGQHLGAYKELRGNGAEAATETFDTYMRTSSLPAFVL